MTAPFQSPEAAPGRMVSVGVYLPDDLKVMLERAQQSRGRGVSYAQIVVGAVAARVDEIDQQLAAERAAAAPRRPKTSRFSPPPQRAQILRGPGGRQVQLRLTAEEVAWLDQVTAEVGAYSRSALVAAALELELTGSAQRR